MIAITIIFLILAVICFVAAVFSFNCKGFLFNNAYIYATEEEREKMNKKPYYIQTGVVLCFIGVTCLLEAAGMYFKFNWIFFVTIAVIIAALVYAIVSTVKINKKGL